MFEGHYCRWYTRQGKRGFCDFMRINWCKWRQRKSTCHIQEVSYWTSWVGCTLCNMGGLLDYYLHRIWKSFWSDNYRAYFTSGGIPVHQNFVRCCILWWRWCWKAFYFLQEGTFSRKLRVHFFHFRWSFRLEEIPKVSLIHLTDRIVPLYEKGYWCLDPYSKNCPDRTFRNCFPGKKPKNCTWLFSTKFHGADRICRRERKRISCRLNECFNISKETILYTKRETCFLNWETPWCVEIIMEAYCAQQEGFATLYLYLEVLM